MLDRKVIEEAALIRALRDCRDMNALSGCIHTLNKKWWLDIETGAPLSRNKGELLMLIVSEIAECMEGARKNTMDSHLPSRRAEEVELADALIRIFDYAGAFGLDLAGAMQEKLQYNMSRTDHTHEARRETHGKKF